jgi:hypothetical protein
VRVTGSFKKTICCTSNGLVTLFVRILMLLVRFTLPTFNRYSAQNVLDLVTNDDLCTIADERMWCVQKLLITFDSIDISHLSIFTNKHHCRNGAIVNSGYIRIDNITCDWFLTSNYAKGRFGVFESLFQNRASRKTSNLRCALKCFLDHIWL